MSARFALLLLASLIGVNFVAAYLLAREGTSFDQAARVQGDMGRLVAIVTALESVDAQTGATTLARSNTAFTRFSLDDLPVGSSSMQSVPHIENDIAQALPGHAVKVIDGATDATEETPFLLLLSVQLNGGPHSGKWLNSLVYPLPTLKAWKWKVGFFVPLLATLGGTLLVGMRFIQRMTDPLRRLAAAARAAGNGDRSVRVRERGARELRDTAAAFNTMQQRIAEFENERTRVLAAIGHDLRTPITSLRIRAELVDDPAISAPMVRILDEMTVMTSDFLQYARDQHSPETEEETSLSELLQRICSDQNVNLRIHQSARPRLQRVAMTRAIGNLIGNAKRYTGSAFVSLNRDGNVAVLTVEDDGPGIPEAQLKSVVEPFVRGESSRSEKTGGVGLGLSIAKGIVTDHGGTLTLSNRPSGGLSAEIRLPLGASLPQRSAPAKGVGT
ncbi:ATP-binding protein [Puniceibacterium sediminis]|uniref:ATP-binding protein n=1 Tax=Puniceibacterium sediminis TaxID=1608407 RepID=UPI000B774EE2|nr:ATP-binding protein [Puniceibacterium sediminis]